MIKKEACLDKTELLDYDADNIKKLVASREWMKLDEYERIGAIYTFVRDEIAYGYSSDNRLMASRILTDGYGHCNTKSILLMALLRAADIPCKLHGGTVQKKLFEGIMPDIIYGKMPESILHSWVEVAYKDKWISLEGVILDDRYLKNLKGKFKNHTLLFCGYGVAVEDFGKIKVDWNGEDTFIQQELLNHDFGEFSTPDSFYKKHAQKFSGMFKIMYEKMGRGMLNSNIKRIRELKYADEIKDEE